jgi:capsular polysaccharide biosynthesis protein
MAGVHIFVSVHGAGMTNMFFMNPGAAVVEIIPYPLCNCRSPDYFYGVGGYYHGSAVAQGIKHYHYCVPPHEMKWHKKPDDLKPGIKCSWKHLHAVESMYVDPTRFVSLMRNVERDLVVDGTIVLTKPIINVSPHANG